MKTGQESGVYNPLSKILHWGMALIILVLLIVGFYMEGLENSPDKLKLYGLHKSFGTLVLFLLILRILWLVIVRPPKALATHAAWEKGLSHLIHALLYGLMIALPLSGWVMSSSGDFPHSFFGLFDMPDIVSKNEGIFEKSRDMHGALAIVLIGAVALHMAGALKHHFIDQDMTLARMTRKNIGLIGGTILALLWGGLWLAGASQVILHEEHEEKHQEEKSVLPQEKAAYGGKNTELVAPDIDQWKILSAQSKIIFVATQYGEAFEGRFAAFDGQVYFDPAYLDQSKAKIQITVDSLKTGSVDRDKQALSGEWFDAKAFPLVSFETQRFEAEDSNRFVAHGMLTMRGVSLPVALPFTLEIIKQDDGEAQARMEATLEINRLDFGIGQGQWSDEKAIGNKIEVKIVVEARKL